MDYSGYGEPPQSGLKNALVVIAVLFTLAGIGYYIYMLSEQQKVLDSSPPHTTKGPPTEPEGSGGGSKGQLPTEPKTVNEVFYVSGNNYTYEDAPTVCAVYNAQLATHEQLLEAFSKGAEWCGYGWSAGGMALFPTQEESWTRRQQESDVQKRTKCGRPGVNGGYFDPSTKFGVNCYGIKPACNNKTYPIQDEMSVPVSGTPFSEPAAQINEPKLAELKQNSGKIKVDPFNRKTWSQWGVLA